MTRTVLLRFGQGRRKRFKLPDLDDTRFARRKEELTEVAAALAGARHLDDLAEEMLALLAGIEDDREFAKEARSARKVAASPTGRAPTGPVTFRDVGELWSSGELHRRHPDEVRKKSDKARSRDRSILAHLEPVIGNIPVAHFTLEDAQRAKSSIPEQLLQGTRRHYALVIRRVLSLAEYPLRLIERNPIPSKFVPPQGRSPVFGFLFPEEDAQLLQHLVATSRADDGFLYGFLDREGMRAIEAKALVWGDIDLERGLVTLDKNKTERPRHWILDPGVQRALAARKPEGARPADLVFPGFTLSDASERFRQHLREAGIHRPQLHARTPQRRPIRIHDLRATFITLALATGKTESWVMERTGHTTSQMLAKYRRLVPSGMDVRWLDPLDRFFVVDPGEVDRALDQTKTKSGFFGVSGTTGNTNLGSSDALPEPKTAASEATTAQTTGNDPAGLRQVDHLIHGVDPQIARLAAEAALALVRIEESLAEDLKALIAAGRYDLADKVMAELRDRRLQRTAPQVTSLERHRRDRDKGGGK